MSEEGGEGWDRLSPSAGSGRASTSSGQAPIRPGSDHHERWGMGHSGRRAGRGRELGGAGGDGYASSAISACVDCIASEEEGKRSEGRGVRGGTEGDGTVGRGGSRDGIGRRSGTAGIWEGLRGDTQFVYTNQRQATGGWRSVDGDRGVGRLGRFGGLGLAPVVGGFRRRRPRVAA